MKPNLINASHNYTNMASNMFEFVSCGDDQVSVGELVKSKIQHQNRRAQDEITSLQQLVQGLSVSV